MYIRRMLYEYSVNLNVHTLINYLQIKCTYIRDDYIMPNEPGLKIKIGMMLWHKQVQKASC